MKNVLGLVVVAALGVISADATAAESFKERVPGVVCLGETPTVAANISYNSVGQAFNFDDSSHVVTCSIPYQYSVSADDSLTIHVNVEQSTACTLRLITTGGGTHYTTSQTDSSPELKFTATGTNWLAANVRCTLPAGGRLNSIDIQRTNY